MDLTASAKPAWLNLDLLRSLDDRQALEALVLGTLSPPADFPRLYGRLRQEEIGKPTGNDFTDELASKGLTGTAEERLARDTAQEYLTWTGTGLRQCFLAKAAIMLDWTARLHLKEASSAWSPSAWVETAQALEAAAELLCLIIEKAPTSSWPAWRSAFGLGPYWSKAFETWETCFFRSPVLAMRWLDELMEARPFDEHDLGAFERLRARLLVAMETDPNHPGLFGELEQRLAAEDALAHLEAVDWSCFLFDGQKPKTPSAVRDAFLAFLRKNEEATRRWLDLPASKTVPLAGVLNPQSALRHVKVALAVMAHHGQATVPQLRALLGLAAQSAQTPVAKDWLKAVDQVLVQEFGAKLGTQPAPATQPKEPTKKSAPAKPAEAKPAKQTLVLASGAVPVPKAPDAASAAPSSPAPSAAPTSIEIPRFAPR